MIQFLLDVWFVFLGCLSLQLLTLPFRCLLGGHLSWRLDRWNREILICSWFLFRVDATIWVRGPIAAMVVKPVQYRCILWIITAITSIEFWFLDLWLIIILRPTSMWTKSHSADTYVLLANALLTSTFTRCWPILYWDVLPWLLTTIVLECEVSATASFGCFVTESTPSDVACWVGVGTSGRCCFFNLWIDVCLPKIGENVLLIRWCWVIGLLWACSSLACTFPLGLARVHCFSGSGLSFPTCSIPYRTVVFCYIPSRNFGHL